jgi:hypothetical protein
VSEEQLGTQRDNQTKYLLQFVKHNDTDLVTNFLQHFYFLEIHGQRESMNKKKTRTNK